MPYVKVVFPVAHPYPLTYLVDNPVPAGARVRAQLKSRELVGVVVGEDEEPPYQCKKAHPIDLKPLVPPSVVRLVEWVSVYYAEPLGLVWAAALPPLIRRGGEVRGGEVLAVRLKSGDLSGLTRRQAELVELLKEREIVLLSELERVWGFSRAVVMALERKGVVELERVPKWRAEVGEPVREEVNLTCEQESALGEIISSLGSFSRILLHGVTGSGKTEVYKRAALEVLSRGKGVLILVPEISLTPHYVKRFIGLFGSTLAVLHSGLSDGERSAQWLGIREGRLKVVIGTRSAVFAPVPDCGLIIVDEEHDPSFKQQESPRYNARDVALVRGRIEGCPVVLGSATPSVETYSNAVSGRYRLVTLKKRVGGAALPVVRVVDMRGRGGIFSEELVEAMDEVLSSQGAVMLLVNRRGYSRVVLCTACGHHLRCPNCDVSLTPYREGGGFHFLCHWCGYKTLGFSKCPQCGSESLRMVGFGTQRVEEEVLKLFPGAKVERMDRERVQSRFTRWKILEDMACGRIDVLVGTQMIAKGHHFPNVVLSAVLNADMGINIPDFRAPERTFQLICQMAGRAGRGERPGKVIVQCYNPDHYAVRAGAAQDYEGFVEEELRLRRALGYPPFKRLLRVIFAGSSRDRVKEAAFEVAKGIREVEVMGPAPCGIEKLKNRFRWHLLLRHHSRRKLVEVALSIPQSVGSVRVFKDMDPYEFI